MLEVVGFLACVGPLVALVAYLVWMSRKPKCPQCQHAIFAGDTACRHCGHELTSESGGDKSAKGPKPVQRKS